MKSLFGVQNETIPIKGVIHWCCKVVIAQFVCLQALQRKELNFHKTEVLSVELKYSSQQFTAEKDKELCKM